MELREIPIADIYPDDKNPRKDFGNINALAESCMLNAINPGEPVNPIVVVQDGGIYRIVDGERRYKAMRHNRVARCRAVVCDDMDEANVMIAMIATDDKQQLNDIERSRGVQQAMLLGVDPAKVESMGRMAKGSAAKLRRARAAVDDAGDDMTLDRMLAIAEFAEVGDDDAVGQLTDCRETEWRQLAYVLKLNRENNAKCDELTAICLDLGITLVDSWDGDMSYRASGNDRETIAEAYENLPDGSIGWISKNNYGGPEVRFYAPATKYDIDPLEALIDENAHEIELMIASTNDRLRRWFASTIDDPEACPQTRQLLMLDFFAHSEYEYRKEPGDILDAYVEDLCPNGITYTASGAFAAYLWDKHATRLDMRLIGRSIATGNLSHYEGGKLVDFVNLTEACIKDGWGREDSDIYLEDAIKSAIEKDKEEEGEDDCENN